MYIKSLQVFSITVLSVATLFNKLTYENLMNFAFYCEPLLRFTTINELNDACRQFLFAYRFQHCVEFIC